MNYAVPLRERIGAEVRSFRPWRPRARPVDHLFIAYRILQVILVGMPMIAGFDKFFHLITNWDIYVSPLFMQLTHIPARETTYLWAPLELAVGLMVALKPRIGSFAATLMLAAVTFNSLITPGHLHLAMLDFCLCMDAVILSILSRKYE
ncbi:MAG TPA: hypothetical protein V6C76_07815 [Drouetiella sp.]